MHDSNETQILLLRFSPGQYPFFFGGEHGFGDGFNARSMAWPSPFTVLGAIKNLLLRQNGLQSYIFKESQTRGGGGNKVVLRDNDKKRCAAELTGHGLNDPTHHYLDQMGVISQMSPLFMLRDDSTLYFPVPHNLSASGKVIKPESGWSAKEGLAAGGLITLEDLTKLWPTALRDSSVTVPFLPLEDFIREEDQVGVRLNLEKGTHDNEKAFYLQRFYRACSLEFSYGVLVKIKTTYNKGKRVIFTDDHVKLGGDASVFRMSVCNLEPKNELHQLWKGLLLSGFIPSQGPAIALGAVVGACKEAEPSRNGSSSSRVYASHRTMIRHQTPTDAYPNESHRRKFSPTYLGWPPGSVFEGQLPSMDSSFSRIGFNHFFKSED